MHPLFRKLATANNTSGTTPASNTSDNASPTNASEINYLHCRSLALDTAVLAYFNSSTSFDASRYNLLPDGVSYDGLFITGEGLSLNGLNFFFLSIYSPLEQILHLLKNDGTQLSYHRNTTTSDPFNGVLTAHPSLPLPVAINFRIGGNLALNGATYQHLLVDNNSYPGGESIGTLIVTSGVTASDCFAYAGAPTAVDPSENDSTADLPNPAIDESLSSLYCSSLALGPQILTYFEPNSSFDVSRYTLETNGLTYNGQPITGDDLSILELKSFELTIHSPTEGILHRLHTEDGQLSYLSAAIASDPFNGVETSYPGASFPVSISFRIVGNMTLDGASYQNLVISNAVTSTPGSISIPGPYSVFSGATVSACFTFPTVETPTQISTINNSSWDLLYCSNISLGQQILTYFDSTTAFDVSRYSLETNGLTYDGQPIIGADLSVTGLYFFHLSIHSPAEGILHHLYNSGPDLLYSLNTTSSDPFDGVETSYPGAPFPVSIMFQINGNITMNGANYNQFVIKSMGPTLPGSVTIPGPFNVVAGAATSSCFSFSLPSSGDITQIGTIGNNSFSVPPIFNATTGLLLCRTVTLGQQILTYFDSTTSFDVSRYSLVTNGLTYNSQPITGADLSLSGLNYFHLAIHSPVEGILHNLFNVGTQLFYSRNTTASDPFNGVATSYPGAAFSVSIFFQIGGNITLDGSSYSAFGIINMEPPTGTVSIPGPFDVTAGVTASDCFTNAVAIPSP